MTTARVETTVAEPAGVDRGLRRELGTWSAAAVVVGIMIGSGIYRLPASVAEQVGSPGAILVLWVVGGLVALCGGLSLAELGVMFPRAGGVYVYLRETYGRLVAFLFGWMMLLVNPASYAAVAIIFAAALGTVVPLLAGSERLVAASMMAVLTAINYRSLRFGAAIQNASTALKVGVLLALAAAALLLGTASGPADAAAQAAVARPAVELSALGLALIAVMFAYDGWQYLPQLAGELRDPGRALPRALGGGVLAVMLIYLVTNVANFAVLSLEEIAASPLVSADVAARVLGAAGALVVGALIAVSTFSSNNGGMMADPRVFFAMAEDGLFFRSVAAVHPRHGTPHVAVLLTGGLAIAYILAGTFEQLLEFFILGMWPFLGLAALAVPILRLRRPDLPRPYRLPLYPATPVFFMLACLGLMANALVEHPISTLASFGLVAAGVPVYFAWRGSKRGRRGMAEG